MGRNHVLLLPGRRRASDNGAGLADVEAAKEIFSGWIEEFGRTDDTDSIRITIVKGISRQYPAAYRVLISGNPEGKLAKGKTLQGHLGRFQTMDTPDGRNLKNFLEHYQKHGKYLLGFAKMYDDGSPLDPWATIEKRNLIVREAWSIGVEDIDSIGIQPEDNPIIPADMAGAPVEELMKQVRS